MVDPKILRKIVKFCHKNGIIRFKSGTFEIELKERLPARAGVKEIDSAPAPGLPEGFKAWEQMTPEERLFWSSTPNVDSNS